MQALLGDDAVPSRMGQLPASPQNDHLQKLLQQVSLERDALQTQLDQAKVSTLTAEHMSMLGDAQQTCIEECHVLRHPEPCSLGLP